MFAVACVSALAAALALATDIFLILFLAVLFGVFLMRLSRLLSSATPLPYVWSLGVVTSSLLLLLVGCGALFGTQINAEVDRARENADEGIERLQDFADRYPSFKSVLRSTPFVRELVDQDNGDSDEASNARDSAARDEEEEPKTPSPEEDSSEKEGQDTEQEESDKQMNMAEQSALQSSARRAATAVAGVFKTTFGLLVNSALIFFVGLFLAISPETYRDGVVTLFPPARRERVREIMNKLGDTLWHWLIGRFGSMLITGCGAGLLLLVLGVPMAFTLGVLTALLTFIPNIGSAIALLLAILFALSSGGTTVLLVVVGYIGLQLVESYIITPLIQQQQVSLPPALLIAFQAVMGVLFGFLGAAVASPLLAVAKVTVEEAYVKDVLEPAGSQPKNPG